MRSRVDIAAALVLAVLALASVFWAVPQETVAGDPGEIAPADVPTIALWVIFGCAIWQAASAIVGRAGGAATIDRFAALFLGVGAMALLAAMLGIWALGYVAGGILCIFAIGAAMGPRGWTWAWLAAVAVALPVAVYFLSWHGLRLSLP